ncbi:GAF sensor signal transduction histidine kinase, partial [Bacillus cereus]|nr:GAF sensor signal transduction histidine kinase [Bacillus cereus]
MQRMGELSGQLAGVADYRDIPGRIARALGELLNCRSAAVHMAESESWPASLIGRRAGSRARLWGRAHARGSGSGASMRRRPPSAGIPA